MLRTARRLEEALSGSRLLGSDFRVPKLATADLSGQMVRETATHGKHLLTRIGDDLTLHTHLKMDGSWRVLAPGRRWPRPTHEARVVLRTDTAEAVGFLLGVVELLPRDAEDDAVGHLGPDLLAADLHEAEAVQRLVAAAERPVGDTLLDQTVVAGLGTIYLAEACFTHGVHPATPVSQVREPARLLRRARQMLQLGVSQGRPVTTGNLRQPLWVYARTGQPCRRCGTPLEAGPIGPADRRRTTYWCPRCQPSP